MTTATAIFERMTSDDRWLGFGYLGERRNALDGSDPESPAIPEVVEQVDRFVVDWADANGWTDEQLFAWANSKDGRWFADMAFGTTAGLPAAARYLRIQR